MNDSAPELAVLTNGQSVCLSELPTLALDDFGRAILAGVAARQRVSALFGAASPVPGATRLYAVLADDEHQVGAPVVADAQLRSAVSVGLDLAERHGRRAAQDPGPREFL